MREYWRGPYGLSNSLGWLTPWNSYGFKKVVTADDIVEQYEHIYPFRPKRFAYGNVEPFPDGARIWRGRPPMKYDEAELKGGNYLKIDHVFVFNDPRDWSLETQIIYDLLISHKGYLGTMSRQNGNQALENDGWQQDGQPTVWVSNLDLLWKTEHPINRFGTGAFVHAFRGVWHEATGRELQFKYMGKPSQITYEYAHECLLREDASSSPGQNGAAAGRPLRRVYMIGDNPESDVRGALEFKPEDGTEYVPILVKTGVWHETEPGAQPRWQPAVIVDDVLDAVVWAMREEGIDIDRNTAEQHIQRGA
jgi:HAD superfamily hydrolase (TIGR01456 family)